MGTRLGAALAVARGLPERVSVGLGDAAREAFTNSLRVGRRLERLRDTQAVLGDDDPLWRDLERVERETGLRLTRPIDDRIGAGAVEDLEVQKKVQDLIRGR